MTTIECTKMHGLGNDFIVIDNRNNRVRNYALLAEAICRRRFHIGADGVLFVEESDIADIRMRVFNSDSSEAEMCGNGIRCFAKYLYDRKIILKSEMSIETKAGIIIPEIVSGNAGSESLVRVNMGKPSLRRSTIPVIGEDTETVINEKITADGREYTFTGVSMGNPHIVIFTDELPGKKLKKIGPGIETHEAFPRKTNVEFVKILNPSHALVQVWERGAGETLACGTGACSVAVAGNLQDLLAEKVTVTLPGGDLTIEWDKQGPVFMTGPAEEVFQGSFRITESFLSF